MKKLSDIFFIDDEFFIFSIPKKIRRNSDYQRLFSNFTYLSILQILNYVFPLITFPYLVRVLGVEKFGLLAFAQATISYFSLIIDYGFNLTAPREVSIHRDNREKLSHIVSSIVFVKFILFLLSLVLLTLLVFSFEKFKNDAILYYLIFFMSIGQILSFNWFFQGIEDMKWITYLNLIGKIIYVFAIFLFIKTKNDYIYIPVIGIFNAVIVSLISLWIILNKYGIKLFILDFIEIKRQFKESWYVFISTIAISLYTVSNPFILGLFTNNTIVGYYSAGEKIVKIVPSFITPLSQTIYPWFSKKLKESPILAFKLARKIFIYLGIVGLFFTGIFILFAPTIVKIVLGEQYDASILVIRILSLCCVNNCCS